MIIWLFVQRKKDEREEKLKNITANIKTSFAKKDPGKWTFYHYSNDLFDIFSLVLGNNFYGN